MVTITIDEVTLNATRAALAERAEHLEVEVARLQRMLDPFYWGPGHDSGEDTQRALVWNIAALHETRMAQEFYAEVEPVAEYPADMTTAQMSWTSA